MAKIRFDNGQVVNFNGNPTPQDIEEVARKLGLQSSAPTAPSNEPGFIQSTAQAIAKPFLSIGSTAAAGAEELAYLGGKAVGNESFAQRRLQDLIDISNGVDTGYLGTAHPLGAPALDESLPASERVLRGGSDILGQLAEAGSYAVAPLKAGAGFWQGVKAAIPAAATFGAGKGLQAEGQGKGAGEASIEGGLNAVGVLATAGLVNKAADIFKIWGARALQSPVVQSVLAKIKQTPDDLVQLAPELLKPGASIEDITNASTRRTVLMMKDNFNRDWKTASNSIIDALLPETNTPELTLSKAQRNLSDAMGSLFQASNKEYDLLKADPSLLRNFTFTQEALRGGPKIPELLQEGTAAERYASAKAYEEAAKNMSPAFQSFRELADRVMGTPMTAGDVLRLNQKFLSYLPGTSNEEAATIRSTAAALFKDMRSVLEKNQPKLARQWDIAYEGWKKASDLYSSSILSSLKNVGDIDSILPKLLGKSMTIPERNLFIQSLGNQKGDIQNLFINSVLRYAKQEPNPNDGAKIIRSFLDNWEQDFLTPTQSKMLDSFASFMDGNFDRFVVGAQQQWASNAADLTAGGKTALDTMAQKSADLLPQQEAIDISKIVNDGRLTDISSKFMDLAKSPRKLEEVTSSMSTEEKNIVALSMSKQMYEESTPVFVHTSEGKFALENKFADAVINVHRMVNDNPALQKLYTPDQMQALDKLTGMAENLQKAAQDIDGESLTNFLRVFMSAFYFKRGWIPGFLSKASQTMKSLASQVEVNDALKQLISEGAVKPNIRFTIGDLIQKFGIRFAPGGSEALNELGNELLK